MATIKRDMRGAGDAPSARGCNAWTNTQRARIAHHPPMQRWLVAPRCAGPVWRPASAPLLLWQPCVTEVVRNASQGFMASTTAAVRSAAQTIDSGAARAESSEQ